jgi:CRISPR/Cas system CSM-associated protein Csm3 (group 7 of RAMP superfamily)
MARKIRSRLKITGDLIAETPVHVGGINNDLTVDLSLAINGQGQYYIPGTNLAGVLRSWMGKENPIVTKLWGFQEQNGKESKGYASYVSVKDAVIRGVEAEIRDGVGIDRYYGAAADQVKFDRAVLPKGSRIRLDMTVEQGQQNYAADWGDCKAELKALLQALQQQEIRLGAAKTRGLGRVRLEDLTILEQDFATAEGIIAILRGQGSAVSLGALSTQEQLNQRSRLDIKIYWEPVGPLMVKAAADGIAVDTLPLTSAVGDRLMFVLPGSAIKGCLRSQAERIVRTVLSLSVPNDPTLKSGQKFVDQLEQVPLIQELFGAASRFKADSITEEKKQMGQIGALAVDDCYARLPISPTQWKQVETATNESQLREALNTSHLENTQQAFHVAIDRWTGGAAENFLYSTLEPFGVSWQPIRLSLYETPRLKNQMRAGIALILLVLRDLVAGRIPLGYATNRGMGAIKVTNVTLSGQGFTDELASLNSEIFLPHGNLIELGEEFLKNIDKAWTGWLDKPTAGVEE